VTERIWRKCLVRYCDLRY